jgi:hypothetical protein
MPKDFAAFDSSCGRRQPAALQTSFQQLVSRRHVIPDGDRRHHAESRYIVHQIETLEIFNEDIVAELVLRHDV